MTNTEGTIAVLGGRGMLGTEVFEVLDRLGFAASCFDLPEFDITDGTMLREVVRKSSLVINCAAYTNVEKAESEAELAFRINGRAAGRLGEFAAAFNRPVLHISTDFVFDGRADRPYVETDLPNPINSYGKSKLEGEKLLSESGCKLCIIRIEWTYGRAGNNFVKKLVEAAAAGSAKPLKVVDDQVGSPTAAVEVAETIGRLLKKYGRLPEGIFHFSAAGYASRFETAGFIFQQLGIDMKIIPCKTSEYKTAAARPVNSRFNCEKIALLLDEPVKPWQMPLKKFLENL